MSEYHDVVEIEPRGPLGQSDLSPCGGVSRKNLLALIGFAARRARAFILAGQVGVYDFLTGKNSSLLMGFSIINLSTARTPVARIARDPFFGAVPEKTSHVILEDFAQGRLRHQRLFSPPRRHSLLRSPRSRTEVENRHARFGRRLYGAGDGDDLPREGAPLTAGLAARTDLSERFLLWLSR